MLTESLLVTKSLGIVRRNGPLLYHRKLNLGTASSTQTSRSGLPALDLVMLPDPQPPT